MTTTNTPSTLESRATTVDSDTERRTNRPRTEVEETLVQLQKSIDKLTGKWTNQIERAHSAPILNRWGHPEAHTVGWMVDEVQARLSADEQLAKLPTQELCERDGRAAAVKQQKPDEELPLDQSLVTGETERMLRQQDRQQFAKVEADARIDVTSEYRRSDSLGVLNGPLDMGVMTISEIDTVT